MIAYKTGWLYNQFVKEQADEAFRKGDISTEEKAGIHLSHPSALYTPNFFIRIGLLLLTLVVAIFSFGLMSITINEFIFRTLTSMLITYGLMAYTALELIIRNKLHYHSGVDDALLWTSAILVFNGIAYNFPASSEFLYLVAFFIALYCTIRFTNSLMALCAFLAMAYFVFVTCNNIGGIFKTIVPFVLMALAAFTYFFNRSLQQKEKLFHYRHCFTMVEIAALISFYIAGNYFVVRELSNLMFDLNLQEGQSIPFGPLFWVFTIVIPAAYLFIGLKRKDIIMVRCGLVLVAATVCTIRHYYHVMPIETAMVICGIVLIGVTYALIRYLHAPKHGYTYEEGQPGGPIALAQIESLVIAETMATQPAQEPATRLGGGSFGGAGAGGDFN
ncbi:MAG TPA: hypothetical protein VLC98_17740 [Phnomibacter sp.]|nr:hypothetical protein [Phnomibacter sp.]